MTEKIELLDRLDKDFKESMKTGNKVKLETLRSLRAVIKEKEISLRGQKKTLTEEEIITTITSAAKKRKEAIEEYRKAGREDRAAEEESELKIIIDYLPEQLSRKEIEAEVKEAIKQVGAQSVKDMGKVMGMIMQKLKGRADGREVQSIVKQQLGG